MLRMDHVAASSYTARPPPPVILPAAPGALLGLGGASRRASPCGLALPPAEGVQWSRAQPLALAVATGGDCKKGSVPRIPSSADAFPTPPRHARQREPAGRSPARMRRQGRAKQLPRQGGLRVGVGGRCN